MADRYTLVSFHAHPDDETLLTGGTLARAAAEGHRVVLVTATLGEAGLAATGPGQDLAARRRAELLRAASALGCARVELFGYPDSGMSGAGTGFAAAPVDEVAERLAAVLREEGAHVLTGYDPRGGYGHPDHVQVHRVAREAARRAGTPLLLEATVDRRALRPLLVLLRLTGRLLPRLPPAGAATAFTGHDGLTHAVDVRGHLAQKRAALRAHASQAEGGRGVRTIAALAALPETVFALVAGREWFTEAGRATGPPLSDDIFAGLR